MCWMADPTISRTWIHEWPQPDQGSSRHSATLLVNDEIVASAEGDDWLDAAHALHETLIARGIPVDGNVLAFSAFERLFQYRRSTARSSVG
jgi:hypothetical protein